MRMKQCATVAEYLREVPPKQRASLKALRATIKAAAPGAREKISYGMPAVTYRGGVLVYYAAFKNHCSFFGAGTKYLAEHQKEVEAFRTSKGTLQFTPEKPLPAALVKKLVKARIKELDAKYPAG